MKRVFIFLSIVIAVIFFHSFYIAAISNKGQSFTAIASEAFKNLGHIEFYEALANPTIAYVKVQEGYRKEQIAEILEDRFNWDDKDKTDFFAYDNLRDRKHEGKYFPDIYLVPKDVSGKEMRGLMSERFDEKLELLKQEAAKKNMNFDSVLTIASIIQREAAGAKDMNLISGIIWNRLYGDMKLQMDATLQYAKGNEENGWWPIVVPDDKAIVSPYNTYQNDGLPPSAISNPGLAAVGAALAPQKTNCLYYFHKDGQIYCSTTYAEHKRKIDLYF
ncbi:MAG TPA: endolytic transglycosylase MltG [Candidatus Paceibacterota bacterium]|nr:endolytic transglycosylase MltG [Candidatus Paceibacterota bacterium]